MNICGKEKDCGNCTSGDCLGINAMGMKVYGCKKRVTSCKQGIPILDELKAARQQREMT